MMPAEYDVAGKVVFITGAGRGIGKGIAEVLAEAGADIALNALTPKYVEDTARRIATASGRRVVPVVADVTRSDSVQRAIDSVLATFGRIDVLVNALGDSIRKPLVALLPGETKTVLEQGHGPRHVALSPRDRGQRMEGLRCTPGKPELALQRQGIVGKPGRARHIALRHGDVGEIAHDRAGGWRRPKHRISQGKHLRERGFLHRLRAIEIAQ